MPELHVTDRETEKFIGVAVVTRDAAEVEESLSELSELVETAGAVMVERVIQNRESVHPGTYIGKGKIEEVRAMVSELQADAVVCDDELSPAQLKNLEEELGCKVLDRTAVILDIFAARASTNEGKLQVEMAQLKYRMSRLAGLGLGLSLSRLGGGVGTRGPGETKLEMDRRLIRDRISQLNRELDDVVRHREVTRQQRKKNDVPVAAIVGYTNAGKSTLLNTLTDAGVLSEDKLFATLDPTTRELALAGKDKVLLTDTVGFIRKLPHHLINAFKSTLEEAKYADMIVHVVDAANPDKDRQMEIVYETLEELGVTDKPVITLFNKWDVAGEMQTQVPPRDFRTDRVLYVSARTGLGLEDFKEVLGDMLRQGNVYFEHVYGFDEAGKVQVIRRFGQLVSEEYTGEGIRVAGYLPKEYLKKAGIDEA
jgi:GTP-binding protein HflX